MPDSNDDLLARLSAQAAVGDQQSNDDILAQLNAEPEPDPLADVEYTGDLPEDSRRELNALQQGFRDRARREAERFRLATDSEYWIAVCFKSREDKERFLRNAGLLAIGDKYMDGYAVARVLGVPMDDQ
ncbi:hypothetical protein SAMN05421810_10192 [Amycolatopsis arida]|uniref:Uncharacterized protein n=1 Tax=Amycolatopsis arida TaxID=587909 RepID=A0A1I5KDH8_9PSEU|nr:hypothetical protein [Amycolatopsis arida]TDX96988.1 hypothetical protein CLV69_10290 [Amycolatopsis arida]SFO82803.1 hypothetical protein SAMN05421810_10192 [Amycolatopsis arida]